MNLEAFAKSMNVDPMALNSLVQFLLVNIEKNQELRTAFLKNPDLVIKAGVEKWLEASVNFFNRFKNPESPEFESLANEVWETLNKKT